VVDLKPLEEWSDEQMGDAARWDFVGPYASEILRLRAELRLAVKWHNEAMMAYRMRTRHLEEADAEIGRLLDRIAAADAILRDPPVPSRMLIPVIREALHPGEC
jgi:hypothetical protein